MAVTEIYFAGHNPSVEKRSPGLLEDPVALLCTYLIGLSLPDFFTDDRQALRRSVSIQANSSYCKTAQNALILIAIFYS
jgi:hypothetical protein